MKKCWLGLSISLLFSSVLASAQDEHAGHASGGGFGSVHFEISCSPASQQQFDRAVAMLHSFFYPETEKAFQAIVEREPSCAMAHWGVAISQRPNPLTAPFSPQLLKQGWEAIQKARAAAPRTERERDICLQGFRRSDCRCRHHRCRCYCHSECRSFHFRFLPTGPEYGIPHAKPIACTNSLKMRVCS